MLISNFFFASPFNIELATLCPVGCKPLSGRSILSSSNSESLFYNVNDEMTYINGYVCFGVVFPNFDVISYTRKQHLVDVTEIFNLLHWEKKKRLFKLAYVVVLLFFAVFWYFSKSRQKCSL
ncbi:hypothetical protein Goshw_028295 [Gossypium schwendimanii]|uniref:Uncharacterized protein n=1 Tax=Gossypium schwendimanii TaxID=34291 RepID=A0A7J9NDJ5_GOSSC|nr:hypothetical protein [Gossypium schwendimanii]